MEGLFAFITITLLIIIVPGPDFMIVMKNTIQFGRLNGVFAALGITTANMFYSMLAVFGIIYLLTSLYIVFLFIKIAGALYLIYLGIQSIRSARASIHFNLSKATQNQAKLMTSYRQGCLSTLLNPKALLYYVSILPHFLENGTMNLSSQILLLTFIVVVVILGWFLLCVFIFQYIKLLFSKPKAKAIFDYTIGFILIALSINLLFTKSN